MMVRGVRVIIELRRIHGGGISRLLLWVRITGTPVLQQQQQQQQ